MEILISIPFILAGIALFATAGFLIADMGEYAGAMGLAALGCGILAGALSLPLTSEIAGFITSIVLAPVVVKASAAAFRARNSRI